jgi:hypothetical protein
MSSILTSPFQDDGIAEVVPHVSKLGSKLAASSVIAARRRVRIVPQSGQTYTGSSGASTVNILIQDGQSYADLASAVLNFTCEVFDSANATGTTIALDDGAFCVFRRALVSLNSTLMDDIDLLPKKVLQETYATVGQDWYDSVGSWMGLYKANTAAFGVNDDGTSFIGKYDVPDKLTLAAARQQIANTGTGSPTLPGQNKYSVPVSMLSSFFRNETLFPLRNAGQLYLQLNVASALEACVGYRSDTTAIVPNFRITDLTLDLDFVDMHPMYLSMMDSVMERPEEDGVRWPFDAHLVSAQNLPDGDGQQNVILSKASQNMRQIAIGVQPQAGLSLVGYPKQSTWANPGFIDVQTRVGSLYFPAFTSVGENRAYSDLRNAYASLASIDGSGIVDVRNYYYATPAGNSIVPGAQTAENYADMWLWSYCFDRLKRAKLEGLDLDGLSTLSTSGSQIVVQLNCRLTSGTPATVGPNPPTGAGIRAAVLTGILRFTRVMEIRGGATRIIG